MSYGDSARSAAFVATLINAYYHYLDTKRKLLSISGFFLKIVLYNIKMSKLRNQQNIIKILNVYQILADITKKQLDMILKCLILKQWRI